MCYINLRFTLLYFTLLNVCNALSSQEKEWDELSLSKESETNDDSRPGNSASDDTQSAERRVTRSAVRQQQNKCKQKAESATSSAHDSVPCNNSVLCCFLVISGETFFHLIIRHWAYLSASAFHSSHI